MQPLTTISRPETAPRADLITQRRSQRYNHQDTKYPKFNSVKLQFFKYIYIFFISFIFNFRLAANRHELPASKMFLRSGVKLLGRDDFVPESAIVGNKTCVFYKPAQHPQTPQAVSKAASMLKTSKKVSNFPVESIGLKFISNQSEIF